MKAKLWLGALLLVLGGWFHASPAAADITFVGEARMPTTADTGAAATNATITPPSGMQTNDYVVVYVAAKTTAVTITNPTTGGQTWTAEADSEANSISFRIFHTRFNGTWSANPNFAWANSVPYQVWMVVFRGVDTTTAIDAGPNIAAFAATTSPFDYTIAASAITTVTANAMVIASWHSTDDNKWGLQTAGWLNPNNIAYWRTSAQTDSSSSIGYKVQAAAGGNEAVTNRQTLNGGDAGIQSILALKPFQCAAVPEASNAAANAQSTQAIVYWSSSNPALILRKEGGSTDAPVNGTPYNVGDTIVTSTVVYNGSVAETSFTDTGVTPTRTATDHYRVFAKTGSSWWSCYAPGVGTEVDATLPSGVAWAYAMAGGSMLKPGIAGEGTIYPSNNAGLIVSLTTAAGAQSWNPVASTSAGAQKSFQGWMTWVPLSSTANAVIAGDLGGKVYAANAATGATFWTEYATGATAIQASVAVQLRAYSTQDLQPGYAGDMIFAASKNNPAGTSSDNKLFAIKASDGTLAWSFNGTVAPDTSVGEIYGMPYVDYVRNQVYFASRAIGTPPRSLWVIDSLTGNPVACGTPCERGHLQTSPTLSYDGATLYVGDTVGNLHAINAGALTLKWTLALPGGTTIKDAGFVWEDYTTPGRLYFTTSDGAVRCYQDNGESATACTVPSSWAVPTVLGASTPLLLNKLFVGSSDGKVHQINLSTGADEKQFPASTTLDGSAVVGDVSTETGLEIFVGTDSGKIYMIILSGTGTTLPP